MFFSISKCRAFISLIWVYTITIYCCPSVHGYSSHCTDNWYMIITMTTLTHGHWYCYTEDSAHVTVSYSLCYKSEVGVLSRRVLHGGTKSFHWRHNEEFLLIATQNWSLVRRTEGFPLGDHNNTNCHSSRPLEGLECPISPWSIRQNVI